MVYIIQKIIYCVHDFTDETLNLGLDIDNFKK